MRSIRRDDQPEQRVGVALPEAGEDVGQRRLEIGDRGRAGIERAQRIDQHDLPVEPREVVAEEGADDDVLVGLVAPLQHGVEAGRAHWPCRRRQRREGQRGRALEIARQQEAARAAASRARAIARGCARR